jgi:hypothetical protein
MSFYHLTGTTVFDPALISPTSLSRIARAESNLAWLDRFGNKLEMQPASPGNLYHVEIRPDKHELLDWDQPFAKHSPEVQSKLNSAVAAAGLADEVHPDVKGKDLYMHLVKATGSPQKASILLHEAGVPGLQFLDQVSRRAPTGEARTHNFVVFHPQNLRITGANGKSLDYVPVSHDPFTGTPLP